MKTVNDIPFGRTVRAIAVICAAAVLILPAAHACATGDGHNGGRSFTTVVR